MKRLLAIVGLPGSGKDTQIKNLKKLHNFDAIFVGDLVREEADKNANVANVLQTGELADHELVNQLTRQAIENSTEELIIIDGFPRDLDQAKWMLGYLEESSIKFEGILYIKIDDQEAMKRLLKRGREDDKEEIISNRLNVFHDNTGKVLEFFLQRKELIEIDGSGTPDEVLRTIEERVRW